MNDSHSYGIVPDPLENLTHFTARELQMMDLEPPSYLVEGIVPEGASLLVAKPKSGKTMFALNVAVAIATGRPAFGLIPVQQGRVLFLALEGAINDMQQRLNAMLEGSAAPDNLVFVREFDRLDRGGLDMLDRYYSRYPDLRLLVIDTFQQVRSISGPGNAYERDTMAMTPLASFSKDTGVSEMIIHHKNKRTDVDALDSILIT